MKLYLSFINLNDFSVNMKRNPCKGLARVVHLPSVNIVLLRFKFLQNSKHGFFFRPILKSEGCEESISIENFSLHNFFSSTHVCVEIRKMRILNASGGTPSTIECFITFE